MSSRESLRPIAPFVASASIHIDDFLTARISLPRANTIISGSTAAEDTGNPRARNRPSEAWNMSSSTTYISSSRKVTKGPAPLRLPQPAPSFIRWKYRKRPDSPSNTASVARPVGMASELPAMARYP